MKLLRKLLILVLLVGIMVGAVWGVKELIEFKVQSEKLKVEEVKNAELIKFAVMSDIHSDWENFKKALEETKIEGFEGYEGFVVITGDLTTLGTKKELLEAKKILDESGIKYYVTPGNHDIWWSKKYKADVWKEVFGASFQSFKIDGYKFILVNNADSEGFGGINELKVKSEKLKVEEKETQTDWLKKEAEECLKVYCLVFMHMPLNHPKSVHIMGEDNAAVASEAASLIKLFVENGVKEIFAGHLHYTSEYELSGLKTTVVGAITEERNWQTPRFLNLDLDKGILTRKTVILD